MNDPAKIVIRKNGPYFVQGAVTLVKETAVIRDGVNPVAWERGEPYPVKKAYILCRCGETKTPPYCDGNHARIGFDGAETAVRAPFREQAKTIPGPGLDLADAGALCSGARFCDRDGGTWELVRRSDDETSKDLAVRQACNCPSGRLVALDKASGEPIEPAFSPEIAVTEDPGAGVSGPLWVKGGIPVESSDGSRYEIRNRVTLCRCGGSKNKPFCDGRHIETGFGAK